MGSEAPIQPREARKATTRASEAGNSSWTPPGATPPLYPPGVDFETVHHFDRAPDEVAEAMLDEAYQRSLSDVGALKDRELLEQRQRGDVTVRRVRCVLGGISGPAKSFLGGRDPAWEEEATWRPAEMRWTWLIHPEFAEELLDARGAIEVKADGKGTLRRVTGRVLVKVPFYGSRIEGFIVGGIKDAYDEEAERLATWLGGASFET